MQNCLEIKGLQKNYEGFQLQNVTFSMPSGCILGLIGENGAGKSTTIKAVLNLIHLDGGKIRVFGMDHIQEEIRIKQEVGVVFDESYFPDSFQPSQIAKMMGKIYRSWDDTLFFQYLSRMKLPSETAVGKYSRGMKMKLNIAAALSHHPKLLLLDEATSGLDPVVRNEILDLFLEFIQEEEHSILCSSHITSDLEKVADYIAYLHEGRLLFCEEKDRLLEEHQMIQCTRSAFESISKEGMVGYRENGFGVEALFRGIRRWEEGCMAERPSIEQIMLYYGKEGRK